MIKIKRLSECTLLEATQAWNEAFSNYSLNMEITVEQLTNMLGKKELSPSLSIVAFIDDKPVGFVFNAVKVIDGVKTAWDGGTGVSPHHQGLGIGKVLMEATLDIYKKSSVEMATLEVLTNNVPAIKLYERFGYKKENTTWTFTNENLKLANIVEEQFSNYTLKLGYVSDVKALSFYNNDVTWESRPENIFNGYSLIVYDKKGNPLGYALFKRFPGERGESNVLLFQCETDVNIDHIEQELIINLILSNVFQQNGQPGRTGDFISGNKLVYDLLKQKGFSITAERYLMNKPF
ncbi:GNAT family N-acetyltransferase [Neobacillus sp. D3-1R]|uniref:GNAT family N-acetyltransferase n=1 Tax=Neobacillus sp. D3-1R TaxID=3445778 RepID=UPI003FA16765